MVCISRDEYERLKFQSNVDVDLMKQIVGSLKDIKEGRIRRVK